MISAGKSHSGAKDALPTTVVPAIAEAAEADSKDT